MNSLYPDSIIVFARLSIDNYNNKRIVGNTIFCDINYPENRLFDTSISSLKQTLINRNIVYTGTLTEGLKTSVRCDITDIKSLFTNTREIRVMLSVCLHNNAAVKADVAIFESCIY